jgi:hypothetical protein
MTAKLTRLTHKVAIQLHLVAESCTICSSRSGPPVRKLLDTPSYIQASTLRTKILGSFNFQKKLHFLRTSYTCLHSVSFCCILLRHKCSFNLMLLPFHLGRRLVEYIMIIYCIRTVFWLENLKGRDHSEDLCVDGRIILEWMLGK